jgi:hypothetical protein
VPFTRRQVTAARVRVREVTAGGTQTLALQSGFGAITSAGDPVSIGQGSIETPRLSLQRVAVLDDGAVLTPGSKWVVRRIT